MPNMDDIAFFESSQYEHRGGIWPDSRRMGMVLPLPQPSPSNSISTISSAGQESSTLDIASATATALHTRSAEELLHEQLESPPPECAPRAASVSGAESYSNPLPENDVPHRSSTTPSNDNNPNNPKDTGIPFQDDVDHERTASTDLQLGVEGYGDGGDLRYESDYQSAPENARRSPSQTSLAQEDSEPDPGDFSSWNPRDYKLPVSPARKASRSSSNSALNASSFLSTLKARATDKEALSKSAKEAMRKWGVNWTSLRRNGTDRTDDMPDHDPTESRSRAESVAHRIRASYADVRAAVAERREKEKDSHEDSNNPISLPISNGAQNISRRASLHSSTDASSERSWHPSSAPEPNPLDDNLSKALDSSSTQSQPRSRSREDTKNVPEPPDPVPQTAIYTQQPSQAKTMTIPGIHPSHRGEVMSMGYVAPPQPDRASKSPAIQSMYRLWKNSLQTSPPSTQGYDAEVGGPHDAIADDAIADDAIRDFADDLGSPHEDHEDHERSVAPDAPPPLPPRPIPTTVPRAPPESPDMEPSKSFATEDEITSWSQDSHSPFDGSVDMTDEPRAEALNTPTVSSPPVLPPRNVSVKTT
jgi:hypothetical protein